MSEDQPDELAKRLAAVVHALGYPDDHTAQLIRRKPMPARARILDGTGRVVASYSEKQLHEIGDTDVTVKDRFAEKLPPDVSDSPPPSPTPKASA